MTVTPTQLRADRSRRLDQVIASGHPLLVSRGGATLRIARVDAGHGHDEPVDVQPLCADLVVGDPGSWVTVDWLEDWNAGRDR